MSLWFCQSCKTLQAFSPNMSCFKCGGKLNYATLTPAPPKGNEDKTTLTLQVGQTFRVNESEFALGPDGELTDISDREPTD